MASLQENKVHCPESERGARHDRFLDLHGLTPRRGLPEGVFLQVASLTPMVNVDLLVRDTTGRILLSWRDDPYSGTGWHVPGGIIRFKERMIDRIQQTARKELGTDVLYSPNPIACEELFRDDDGPRSHFITFVYDCRLPENFCLPEGCSPQVAGTLAWHTTFPEDMIAAHRFYRNYFKQA